MNRITKIFGAAAFSTAMFFAPVLPILAAEPKVEWVQTEAISRDDATDQEKELISSMIYAYGNGDRKAAKEKLTELEKVSKENWYPVYNQVINYWDWIEDEMPENIGVAPDGIKDPANHCFIVLGFALNDDGTMTDELVGRLETAKASLDKYPESYVLVTGGVEKNGWTEGQRMHDWLIDNGIKEDRIFVEKKAPDTAGNATNSFEILYDNPNIKSVSLITSQYHLKRGSLLYFTEDLIKAKEKGVTPILFLGEDNAGWKRDDKTSEPLTAMANSMYSIARVEPKEAPELDTDVTDLDIIFDRDGGNVFETGAPLDVVVKTIDSKGMNLTVTDFTTFTGYDANTPGTQTVTATFTNNGKTVTKDFEVQVGKQPQKEDAVPDTGADTLGVFACAMGFAGIIGLDFLLHKRRASR